MITRWTPSLGSPYVARPYAMMITSPAGKYVELSDYQKLFEEFEAYKKSHTRLNVKPRKKVIEEI